MFTMNLRKTFMWKIAGKARRKLKTLIQMNCKYDNIPEEHLKHFGKDFPDKVFYVIRKQGNGNGLFGHFSSTLDHVAYALIKGYIPVINMENYKIFCNEKKAIDVDGKKTLNAWEYYFEQPCGYSLKDIRNAKNVILADMRYPYSPATIAGLGISFVGGMIPDNTHIPNPFGGKANVQKYYEFVSQYLKLNSKTTEHVEREKDKLFGSKKNILGCSVRGSDYHAKFGANHFAQPTVEQMFQKIQEVCQTEKFDYIFVCTEEQETIDMFCKFFPQEKIIFLERERVRGYKEQQGTVIDAVVKMSSSLYKNALDYLTEMYLLSQCDGTITSKCGGNKWAMGLNNNKYRFSFIFDLGVRV